MIVDLKIDSSKEFKDVDILIFNAASGSFVPMGKAEFIKLFGFNLTEVQTAIKNTDTRIKNAEGLVNTVATETKAKMGRIAQRQINFVKIFKGGTNK